MELNLTTPAIVFSAISLIYLAYTQRFLALANIIRNLIQRYQSTHNSYVKTEINNLRHRINLIRIMQATGVISIFSAIISICFIYIGIQLAAQIFFCLSLFLLLYSLFLSTWEIMISTKALETELLHLEDVQDNN